MTAPNSIDFSEQVGSVLRQAFGTNTALRIEKGGNGKLFIRMVSEKLDGMSDTQKQDEIWNVLRRNLQEDAQRVALVLAFGIDQI